jgi:hypothetical protein
MRKLSASLGLFLVVLLTGCSTGTVSNLATGTSGSLAVQSLQGVVHGGQQAITSANVQLWEVGTTGYGSAPTLLYSTSTNGSGNFNFPIASWTTNCTNVNSGSNSSIPVYITSTGGDAGSGTNTAILLMAALGPCNNINAATFVNIDEVTTVAAAYALGQFMNPANSAQIGYLSSQTGIQNAFTTAGNLVNIGTGTASALTPNGNGSIPQTEINTLADILASCVNGSATNCTTLFNDAFNSSGSTLGTSFTTPTNTLMAAQQIAAYPGNNVGALFGLAGGIGAPFQTTLTSAPNDWTVGVEYAANSSDTSSTTNARSALAVDASDNVWIANLGQDNVETLNSQGVPMVFSPQTNNISTPTALAIDTQGNAWVANYGNNTVLGLCASGGQCGNIYNNTNACNNNSPCGIANPYWLAFDGSGNLWVVNNGTPSLTELLGVGNSGGSGNNNFAIYTPSSVVNPEFVALDVSGNAWVADYGSGRSGTDAVEKLSAHGVSLAKETGSGLSDPEEIAIDRAGNIWVGNKGSDRALTEYNSSGTVLSGSGGFIGGGLAIPTTIAVDGANRIWTANAGSNSISEFSNGGAAISPSTGYTHGGISPSGLAIDKSGNVWVASGTTTAVSGTSFYGAITEFVGAAAPVVTPQMQALQNGQLAVTPGTPTPVSILTNTLPYYARPAGSYTFAYSAQLQAVGGSGSYTWSTTSTTILTNAGLALSAAGVISGTPTQSGPLTINVTVADSTNGSNTASTTLTLNSADQLASSPGANDSELKGTYTFFVQGMKNSATSAGVAPMTMIAGSMTADGNGNLTGELDYNNKSGLNGGLSSGPVAFTGYYTVSSSNVGLMTVLPQLTGQNALNFAISAGSLGTSPVVYQSLQLMRYDDTGVTSSGTGTNEIGGGFAKLRTSATLGTGSWVFGFGGETPCTTAGGNSTCAAGLTTPYGPLSEVGVFTTGSSSSLTGEEDASAVCPQSASSCGAYNYSAVTLAGSYGTADSDGRGTVTLTPTGSLYPDPPTHYLYYAISATEVVMMSSDSHVTYSLLGGDVALQQGTISNNTFATGATLLPYGLLPANGDGTSVYPTQGGAQIVYGSVTNPDNTNCSGSPSVAITIYQNNDGNYQVKPQGTLCVNIASNGRLTFTGAGSPVGYVAGSSLAMMSQQVSNPGDNPGILRTEPQTATAFTTCNMFGGTLPPPVPMTIGTGYTSASSCPTTTYTQTGYQSYSYGLLESGTQTLTIGTPNSSGVVTGATDSAGNNYTVIVVSGTKWLVIDANQGDTTPALSTLQK